MPALLARIVSVLCAVITCIWVVNALFARTWQFGVAALAFAVWTIGWWALGAHWAAVGASTRVVLDARTGIIAGVMVVVFLAVGLCLSTLG